MQRIYITFAVLFVSLFHQSIFAQCGTCTQTWNGTDGSIPNLANGTTYCITSGTFTGTVGNIAAGATLCVGTNAIFKPSSMNGNYEGSIMLYGTSELPGFNTSSGLFIKGFKQVIFKSNINFNGTNITISNAAGASMFFLANLPLNGSGSALYNNGVIRMSGDFNTQSGTLVSNRGDLRLEGNFNPSGVVTNNGAVYANAFININSGSSVTNNCRFISAQGFNNMANPFINNGLIWVTGANKMVQNNSGGIIVMGPQSAFRGADFINGGTVTGSGVCYFTGDTRQQGTFAGTSSIQPMIFWDNTATNLPNFFDAQSSPPTNTYRSMPSPIPDTTFFGACSDPNFTNLVPSLLPIVLKSFAIASSTSPYTIFWEVENTADIRNFIIEQSLNGTDFSPVAQEIAAAKNAYAVALSSAASFASFYRLKLVGKDGQIIYSQIIRTGKDKKNNIVIKNAVGTAQVWLLSDLDKATTASLSFYNTMGQLVYSKNVNLMAGSQQVSIALPANVHGVVMASAKTNSINETSRLLIP